MEKNLEAEAAILAGLLGFFTGGVVSFALGRDVVEVFLAATVCGVAVFVLGYYAILLIRHGRVTQEPGKKAPRPPAPGSGEKPGGKTGQKIDIVTGQDDDIYKDIYRT